MDLSIITPVYNTKFEYLNEYYNSIVKNCSKISYEIVMVDDGSTLEETCEWLKNHETSPSVKIIRFQNNCGISKARNTAIDAAEGDYILTVDSDDYLSSESICTIVKTAKKHNIDICFAPYTVKKDNFFEEVPIKINGKITYYQLERIPTGARIIKRAIINKYHIRYPLGKLCEDPCFNFCCMLHARQFDVADDGYMTIRSHADSTCHRKSVFHAMRYDQIPFEYIQNNLCIDMNGNIDSKLKEVHYGEVAHFLAAICCVFSSKSVVTEKCKIDKEAVRLYREYIENPVIISFKYLIHHKGLIVTRLMQFGFALSIKLHLESSYIQIWRRIIKE